MIQTLLLDPAAWAAIGPPLANHLWQSTLFAALAGSLVLLLRKNHARARHWLWLAASVKFLVPFSLLVSVGSQFEWRTAPSGAPSLSSALEQITQPFATLPIAAVATPAAAPASPYVPAVLVSVWLGGCLAFLSFWWVRWRQIRTALRTATPLSIQAPIEVMSSSMCLEPGVFGVFRPVLLLPEGITSRLTPPQLMTILAHEFCHVRRRDNLTAAVHMAVEALFWFHPLVWWIGAQLVEERERACDEEVLRLGSEPEVYAAGILNVCKFYLESPLACASGVTGSDLKKRIEAIMTNRILLKMTFGRKLALSAAGIAAVAGPIGIGIVNTPRSHAQSQATGATPLVFEVASIKPSDPDSRGMRFHHTPGNGLSATGVTLKTLIEFAYDVQDFQISGGPRWFRTDRYDILAKPERPEKSTDFHKATDAQRKQLSERLRERTRALLVERFQLSIHRETEERPVYMLVLAKNGHKLQEPTEEDNGISRNFGQITANAVAIQLLAKVLSSTIGRPVLDRTGLDGKYKFKLEWTEDRSPIGKGDEIPTDANPPDPSGPSIFSAIQQQLGLKLESQKGPVEIIVIDRAEKPSAN